MWVTATHDASLVKMKIQYKQVHVRQVLIPKSETREWSQILFHFRLIEDSKYLSLLSRICHVKHFVSVISYKPHHSPRSRCTVISLCRWRSYGLMRLRDFMSFIVCNPLSYLVKKVFSSTHRQIQRRESLGPAWFTAMGHQLLNSGLPDRHLCCWWRRETSGCDTWEWAKKWLSRNNPCSSETIPL